MRLEEDFVHVVHQVDRTQENWLRYNYAEGTRVNAMVRCDLAKIGRLYHEDGPVTCLRCLGL